MFKASIIPVKLHNLFIISVLYCNEAFVSFCVIFTVYLKLKRRQCCCVFYLFYPKANKNLDMSINASNNFNLNITWSVGSTGNVVCSYFFRVVKIPHFSFSLILTCTQPIGSCYLETDSNFTRAD